MYSPTDSQPVVDQHTTDWGYAHPSGAGIDWIDQVVPSHTSAKATAETPP